MKSIFKRIADLVAPEIVLAVKAEIVAQGHNLTGALVDSVEAQVKEGLNSAKIELWLNDYGIALNTGVRAENIPYTPGSKAASSKYIQGLFLYARLRFRLPPTEARKAAFRIANKQLVQGMPTKGSFKFSKTGKRTEFLEAAQQKSAPKIEALISELVEEEIETFFGIVFKADFFR